jgi:hypothetical protein
MNILVSIPKIKEMDWEKLKCLQEIYIKAFLKMMKEVAKELVCLQAELSTKENGETMFPMDKEFYLVEKVKSLNQDLNKDIYL